MAKHKAHNINGNYNKANSLLTFRKEVAAEANRCKLLSGESKLSIP